MSESGEIIIKRLPYSNNQNPVFLDKNTWENRLFCWLEKHWLNVFDCLTLSHNFFGIFLGSWVVPVAVVGAIVLTAVILIAAYVFVKRRR